MARKPTNDRKSSKPDTAVIVVSCDKYSDLWNPFFAFFDMHWPECPYSVYLGTNELDYEHPGVTVVQSGPDETWSKSLIRQLEQVEEDYVIMLLEDLFLRQDVDTAEVERLGEIAKRHGAACMRLFPVPPPTKPLEGETGVGVLEKGELYRVSTMCAIWHKESLLEILHPEEDPWQFEGSGTVRSYEMDRPFLSTMNRGQNPIQYLWSAVDRGVWLRGAIKFCHQHGVRPDLSKRPIEPFWPYFRGWAKGLPGSVYRGVRRRLSR